ncbi:MAG: hypothetical protein K8I82_12430 [Anaerolineae bacterium]|nr:hypothetical protein [Anaerolineae bacterium]
MDSKPLALIVAQAAQHLHAVVSNIATALLEIEDGSDRILFSNSALTYINGSTLLNLARHYLSQPHPYFPCLYCLDYAESMMIYFIVLDYKHVFAVIGKTQDAAQIEAFSQRLGQLLAVQPA